MMGPGWSVGAALVAVIAAAWAGFLTLAQEAPEVARGLGAPPPARGAGLSLYQALQGARLALAAVAGAAAGLGTVWWARATPSGLLVVVLAVALVGLVADVVPRGLGALLPDLARASVQPARRTLLPLAPLLGLVAAVERTLAVAFPVARARGVRDLPGERDVLQRVLALEETTVADAMTPRLDVAAIPASSTWPEVVEELRRSEHARLPVFGEDLDEVAGILYAKDVLPIVAGLMDKPADWHELIRPAAFVPESKSLAAQLRDFQHGPAHLAIVVDEFGGTSGLVTLEDVLEEVVGEIHGEYDEDVVPPIEREGDGRFWVDGAVTLDTLSEAIGMPVVREDVSTVGGLVYSELGHVPRPGEELRVGAFRVVVEKVTQRRVHRVYFERVPEAPENPARRTEVP